MSIGIINPGLYSRNIQGYKSGSFYTQKTISELNNAQTDGQYMSSMRKLETEHREAEKRTTIVDQSLNYASQLAASRSKSKDVSLEKKKLQYNFKKISSQIVRSKNSVSARKAVQAAKREIMRLKRLKGSGEYDDEELQLAIDHAKSMEKVAKKKVAHLEQEEMVERAHKGFGASLEEIEDRLEEKDTEDTEESDEEELNDEAIENLDVDEEYVPEYDYQYEMQLAAEEYQQNMQIEMQEMLEQLSENTEIMADSSSQAMTEMMDELSQEMVEMLEELDLTELSETLIAPNPNMSEQDLKMLKIKHRGKEMKEIAEADKEYLKGIMEHEKNKAQNGGAMPTGGGTTGGTSSIFGSSSAEQITPVISMPGSAAGGGQVAPTISGGFSVSI